MNERSNNKLVDVSKFQNYWTTPIPERVESYVTNYLEVMKFYILDQTSIS